mmetsp:Transcript_40099/g.55717  ORF Transcript_40099/g.55717 Transcript_40099/m.55717 type:complete len:155 (+) Transcript_40099:111-575(+)|eukprot:CAMPEP_0196572814 /NCGR_PEP_ID=MMETSP1081-20130531/2797_1 /TAXON_ID=36882 /ORGANISM="Pyramimonas amylifera, Strain CCMP720" /LENGTH=154 /DNA_ID=CAMNT_0041890263 /DNA_START=108 /DNA_END=572 /DNA_ORIENTATION=+
MADGGVSLGKGAWDCTNNVEIPPEKEAEVFEEIATMDFPFEGIPTIPPRKDMDHFAFFCDGCRYRVKGNIDECAKAIKQRLWEGGCGRGGDMTTGKRKLIPCAEDIILIYAGQKMADDLTLREYHVPPGCKTMIAIDKRKILAGKPDADSAYWN